MTGKFGFYVRDFSSPWRCITWIWWAWTLLFRNWYAPHLISCLLVIPVNVDIDLGDAFNLTCITATYTTCSSLALFLMIWKISFLAYVWNIFLLDPCDFRKEDNGTSCKFGWHCWLFDKCENRDYKKNSSLWVHI